MIITIKTVKCLAVAPYSLIGFDLHEKIKCKYITIVLVLLISITKYHYFMYTDQCSAVGYDHDKTFNHWDYFGLYNYNIK